MKSKGMDLFEKFWIDHTGCGADDFCFYEGCYTCEYMQDAWVAWQSQQAKIDEVNEKHSEEKRILHNVIEMNQAKIDELQARIDTALEKCYTGIRKQGGDYYLELVEDILKGNKDEN